MNAFTRFVDRTDELFANSQRSCEYVQSADRAHELLEMAAQGEAALDFETTGLDPSVCDIRLTSVCNDDLHFLIDHYFLGDFKEYIHHFKGGNWWVYNAKFEAKFLDHHSADHSFEANVLDVDFAKKVKMGGSPSSLARMCRDIGVVLNKDEQSSDWGTVQLTKSQLDYAGFDSYVTWLLKKKWWDEELTDEHRRAFPVFNDAVRGTVECEDTGLYLNYGYHNHVVEMWKRKHAIFERYIRKWTPPSIIKNLNSGQQIAKFLERELHPSVLKSWPRTGKTKQLQLENSYLKSVARRLPYPMSRWMAAVVGYRYYSKYLSTYGDTLLTKQALSGKITSRFNIAQAATGRYSSSKSNLQNIPRKPLVRRSFCCPPVGDRVMCLADYSGIEVRVLAELSGDEQLRHDAIYGDVHAASAAQIFGHDVEYVLEVLKSEGHGKYGNMYPVIKEQRSKAKGFTFQLTYGAGAGALSDVLRCTLEEAEEAIGAWAARYPKAYNYRHKMFDVMQETGYLPVTDGRTIYVWKNDRSMPVAANYPIQGAAASVMYRAVYWTRELFLDNNLDAFLAATVHDELLSYAHKDHAERAMAAQLDGMTRGWLDIFPDTDTANLTEWKIGTTWADKP